jgi:photosystem II stability/assembly factor-like uncharacterized protein
MDSKFCSLAISAGGDLFAGTHYDGVFRSTDGGATWVSVLESDLPNFYIMAPLALNSSGHIFAGMGTGVYRSTDNGKNWTRLGLEKPAVQALAMNAAGHLFVGAMHEVYRSTDQGAKWVAVGDGLPDLQILSLAVAPSGHLLAGTAGGGVFRTSRPSAPQKKAEEGLPGRQ